MNKKETKSDRKNPKLYSKQINCFLKKLKKLIPLVRWDETVSINKNRGYIKENLENKKKLENFKWEQKL